MGFFSGIGDFFKGLIGQSDDEKKKKQQQAAAQSSGPQVTVARPAQDNTTLSVEPPAPDNGVKLTIPGTQLKKVAPSPAPAPTKIAADIGGSAGYGPQASPDPAALVKANPPVRQPIEVPKVNMPLETVKQAALGIGHTFVDPAVKSFNEMQTKNEALRKAGGSNPVDALKTTAAQTGNFVKAIGQTGAEYAAYVAPELKGLQAAADASKLVKVGTALLRHGATSAPLSIASDLATGERDPIKIAGDAGVSTLAAGTLGALGGLRKAGAPTEVAPGVHSVNPAQEADAAKVAAEAAARQEQQVAAQQAQLDTPAYRRQGKPDPQPQAPLDIPTFQRNNADELVKAAQDRVAAIDQNLAVAADRAATPERVADFGRRKAIAEAFATGAGPGRATTDLIKARAADMNPAKAVQDLAGLRERAAVELGNARLVQEQAGQIPGAPEVRPPAAAPVPETPAAVTPQVPVDAPLVAEPAPIGPETPPLATSPEPAPAAPVPEGAPPVMPESAAQPTADAAPLTHDALVKSLGPVAQPLKGKFSKRLPLNIDELKQNAAGVIANMPDEALLKSFSTVGPETMVHDAQSFSLARAALDRLSQMAGDDHAVQTVTNILDSLDRFVSKSGEGLRIAQEAFDTMPLPMKVRYIIKKIDAANAGTKDYQALADDPAKAAVVEATITGHLNAGQAISEKVAAVQGQLNEIADAVKSGASAPMNPRELVGQLKTLQRDLAANNGELVKYYSGLVPGRSLGQKALVDFPRRMMLASFTGRVNDILTTGANAINLGGQNLLQGLAAKVLNKVKPGLVTDTTRGLPKVFSGAAEGLKKVGGEIRGKQYSSDLAASLKGNTDARSGLQKAKGPVGRTIQAATEAATYLTGGIRDQRIYQLAVQEGQKAGLKGKALNDYSEARAAVPTHDMIARGEQLHMEVNNLNNNPVSEALNRVASAIQGDSAIGGLIKNQIMPFTSWAGGNIWNSLTDKNVVASFAKVIGSVAKGDTEGIVRNLAKLGNNAAQTYALGYLLTKSGVLTNKDAEGYNDAGAYLHIGDRYIPVGFLGFAAPNIVLGNAAYNALNSEDATSPGAKLAQFAGESLFNLSKSINLGNSLGVESNLNKSVNELNKPGGGVGDAAATFAAGVAGQGIPAITSDINAGLNNTDLNPTHEKADTKVVDPNSASGTAKDVPASAVRSLENKIPGVSQSLPRKQNVAADDLLDRTTRGNRDTTGGKEIKQAAKTEADRTKDFKARNVPDPKGKNFDDTVQARVEDGNFDSAIEGLQAKLADNQKDKNIPKSKNKEIEDHIKTLEVTKKGKYDPSMIETYKKTSLSEWRDMGDSESDNYDPAMYQKLFAYDRDLAAAAVSRNTTKATDPLYSAKKPGKGRGGGKNSTVTGNTIGSTPNLAKVSLGNLAPQKAGSVKMPTIQEVKAGDLIKKRKISVSKA